ncbi:MULTISPECIES: hypothetical protein, partial [Acinetobacter calcoaceticus/baumannii complex]
KMYQCAQIDQATNQCLTWVQVGFLGLPEITYDQAGDIAVGIAICIAVAWGFKKIGRLLK